MPGKMRPSLRAKTLLNVRQSNLSATDKNCILYVFKAFEELIKPLNTAKGSDTNEQKENKAH